MAGLTHFDERGAAHMVDVSDKDVTARVAVAEGHIRMARATYDLISEGRAYMREAAWLTVVPGVAIAVTALGLNLLGDGLRDVLDPRMKVAEA